jgi:quercetin dioxygenase-like cupin family protein
VAITHLSAREGESLSIMGEVTTLKIRHAAYTMFASSASAGQGLPPHSHEDQDEAIYVLAGEYLLASGEDRLTLTPGSFAFVPRGTVHFLEAAGAEPARCLVVFNPPGAMERFFDELRAARTEPDGEDRADGADGVLAIARRLGIALLTSPV